MMKYTSPIRKRIEEDERNNRASHDTTMATSERPGAATGYREISPEAIFLPYGSKSDDGSSICEILATCGEIEAEYAAFRRGVGVMDMPNRT
ncbi:MAG: hypothetical protein O7G85_00510, partial [Planctomycetota bacterium]|nr:hypothetical protein [Planctomycetota bacterium]